MSKEISIGVKLITDLKDFVSGFKSAQDTTAKFGQTVEKQVSAPLNKLEAQLRALKAAQKRSLSPEDYAKVGDEIKKVSGEIDRFKGKSTSSAGGIGQMVGMAKTLLPAFGFAAIGAGAAYAFSEIKNSTDTLATQWEIFTGGITSGMNEFWRTLATGDWSNFLTNMKEAVAVGREYANMMDSIEEKTRALSISEADAQARATALEIKLKNKQLSKAERIAAGEERLKIEEELAAGRIKVAQDAFDAEVMVATQQTKLSKEKLMQVVSDMDSEAKVRAQAYNDQLKQIQELRAANQTAMTNGLGNVMYMQNADTPEILALKQQIDSTAQATKDYAAELVKTGNTTDEQLNKMVQAYVNLQSAQNSAAENTKKVQTTINSLLAATNTELSKEMELRGKIAKQLEGKGTSYAKITNTKTATSVRSNDELNSSQKGQLGYMGGMLDENTKKVRKFKKELSDFKNDQIDSLAGSFGQLGDAIGGTTGSFLGMVGTILNLIPTLLAQIAALTTAQVASSNSITMAKGSEAIASGTAASQSLPFPFNLVALAATIGSIIAALATPIKGFAFGGVVPGTSFSGDNVLIRANSGEEVLTSSDPRHSKNRGMGYNSGGTASNVEIMNSAIIKAESIHILNKKAERRINRRT